jgi:hypothetical protein
MHADVEHQKIVKWSLFFLLLDMLFAMYNVWPH